MVLMAVFPAGEGCIDFPSGLDTYRGESAPPAISSAGVPHSRYGNF